MAIELLPAEKLKLANAKLDQYQRGCAYCIQQIWDAKKEIKELEETIKGEEDASREGDNSQLCESEASGN